MSLLGTGTLLSGLKALAGAHDSLSWGIPAKYWLYLRCLCLQPVICMSSGLLPPLCSARQDLCLSSVWLCTQVVHHPTVLAAYGEGRQWTFEGDSDLKSKFWGRSIELTPVGILKLTFHDREAFSWSKVRCWATADCYRQGPSWQRL